MKSILGFVGGPPNHPDTERALDLLATLRQQGHNVQLCLVKDGVLCAIGAGGIATNHLVHRLADDGIACYYLESDLRMRGFGPEDTIPGVAPTDYERIVDLLESCDQTLGVF